MFYQLLINRMEDNVKHKYIYPVLRLFLSFEFVWSGEMKVIIGISGGSGALYALALLRVLNEMNIEIHLVISRLGAYVVEHECGVQLEELKSMATFYYDNQDLAAHISSGSFEIDGMVIVPCSMNTLSCVANGFSNSLLTRAADVTIKERRKFILVPREMPFSSVHLENMLKVSRLGVTVLPPCPGFYNHPENISDIVSSVVGKILDHLDIEHHLIQRWGE